MAVTQEGAFLAEYLAQTLSADLYLKEGLSTSFKASFFSRLSELVRRIFQVYQALIFVMAQGIVTRVIAPFLRDKHIDPAVVVLDEKGRFVISTLSGHEGGANDLALWISSLIGAEPVITTASEARRTYVVGLGWRKGKTAQDLIAAVNKALAEVEVSLEEVRLLATAWVKREDPVAYEAAKALGTQIRFIPKWLIDHFFEAWPWPRSRLVYQKIGVYGVAEPCALLAGQNTRLVLERQSFDGVTVAVAREHLPQEILKSKSPEILVLGGTTEAVKMAKRLRAQGRPFYLSTATDYGYELFSEFIPDPFLVKERFTEEGLRHFVQEKGIKKIIDCTHPYAQEITKIAQKVAKTEGLSYLSAMRKTNESSFSYSKLIQVFSLKEAAKKILELDLKRVLFTTGSKDLSFVPLLEEREVFVRVLPYEESILACLRAGLKRRQIIALQGPFSKEFNLALIRELKIQALITKKSGREGGYPEKIKACQEAGIWAIVVEKKDD